MSNFFYIFPNMFFSKTNNEKIIPLITFYVFTLLLLFPLHRKVIFQKKEEYMNMYRYFICNYTYLCIFM